MIGIIKKEDGECGGERTGKRGMQNFPGQRYIDVLGHLLDVKGGRGGPGKLKGGTSVDQGNGPSTVVFGSRVRIR